MINGKIKEIIYKESTVAIPVKYCGNNPVSNVDPTGCWIESAIDAGFIAMDVADIAANPSDGWAWAALVADVICVAVPVLVGGRLLVKGSEGAIDAGTKACFVAGTQILTNTGHKHIEEIKVGDLVYSENPETDEKGLKKVVRTFVHDNDTLLNIYVGETKIETTAEHPF